MTAHQTSRTLVKSAPELWAECSDAASLARHLGAFGEIRITKLEPETAVAWEGAAVSGTVRLEPSGWGTRVTLTMIEEAGAVLVQEPTAPPSAAPEIAVAVAATPEIDPEAEPDTESEPLVTAPDTESEPLVTAPDTESEPPVTAPPPRMLARLRLALRRKPGAAPVVEEGAAAESPAIETVAETRATDPPAADPPVAEAPVADAPAIGAEDHAEPPADTAVPTSQGEPALAAALDSLGRAHHRPYSR
jgi:hypothetical protein